MNIYRLVSDSDKFNCIEVRKADWPLLDLFTGTKIGSKWRAVKVKFDTSMGRFGDFPSLRGGIPVLSEKAWGVLQPAVGNNVEAFEMVSKQGRLFGSSD